MVKVNPKIYRKYVTINSKGKSLIYVKMYKDLYGFLRSVLFFYKNLVGNLEVYRIINNSYGTCMANMDTKIYQTDIVRHVDDLKVSYKDSFEFTRLAVYLTDIYVGLKVNPGNVHDYLGI